MELYISSKALARRSALNFSPTAIISIVSPEDEHPIFSDIVGDIPTLNIKFHDVTFPHEFKNDYTIPSKDDVLRILKFSEENLNKDSRLLVHCFAGISRSSAAAIIAASVVLGYEGAIKKVSNLEIFPNSDFSNRFPDVGFNWFVPNNLMIEWYSEIVNKKEEIASLMNESFVY